MATLLNDLSGETKPEYTFGSVWQIAVYLDNAFS